MADADPARPDRLDPQQAEDYEWLAPAPTRTVSETYFPDLTSFVRHLVLPALLPRLDGRGRTWCPQWWDHAGAVMRLEALWRSWELSRIEQDDMAMSVWLRDHADYHVERLLDGDATFRGCSPERGHRARGGSVPWQEPPAML